MEVSIYILDMFNKVSAVDDFCGCYLYNSNSGRSSLHVVLKVVEKANFKKENATKNFLK